MSAGGSELFVHRRVDSKSWQSVHRHLQTQSNGASFGFHHTLVVSDRRDWHTTFDAEKMVSMTVLSKKNERCARSSRIRSMDRLTDVESFRLQVVLSRLIRGGMHVSALSLRGLSETRLFDNIWGQDPDRHKGFGVQSISWVRYGVRSC